MGGQPDGAGLGRQRRHHEPDHRRHAGLRHRLRLRPGRQPRGHFRRRPRHRQRSTGSRTATATPTTPSPSARSSTPVSHEHFCGNIGSFPQTNPWTFYRATAFTTYPTGTVAHNSEGGYADWFGNPDPTQLDWYPTLTTGTYTGQNQAAWSVTGNTSYVALGGEFPTVNGTAQQGLVRFAVRSIAPNKVGPRPVRHADPERRLAQQRHRSRRLAGHFRPGQRRR